MKHQNLNKVFCFLAATIIILLNLSACTKSLNGLPPVVPVKEKTITIIKGDSQTDSIGKPLKDSVVININEPSTLAGDTIIVKISKTGGCYDDEFMNLVTFNHSNVAYKWSLVNKVGEQKLTIRVYGKGQKLIDSVTLTATALPLPRGVPIQGCRVEKNESVYFFKQTNKGRIFAGGTGTPITYSDDNGYTWNIVDHLFPSPTCIKMVILPGDDIFFASILNGIYRAHDSSGIDWVNSSDGIPLYTPVADFAATSDGRLVFTGKGGGIYMSSDKGVSWQTIIANEPRYLIIRQFVTTLPNGDMIFTQNNSLVKLDHIKSTIIPLDPIPSPLVLNTAFADADGNWLIGGYNNELNNRSADIYRSTDKGASWKKVFSMAPKLNDGGIIDNFSRQRDGLYYFGVTNMGYYKTADFVNFSRVDKIEPSGLSPYLLTADGYFLMQETKTQNIWFMKY